MAPEPVGNPFENLIRLMLLIFFIFSTYFTIGGRSDMPVEPPRDGGASSALPSGSEVLTVIDSVDALILESAPPQINLHVTGYQPDGCTFPVQVEQSVDGNNINVRIYRMLPPDIMCTMQLVSYDETIPLGSFESGEYTIDVNGTVITVNLQ
jgi:hypothetical protein